jgi:hypothetical protein
LDFKTQLNPPLGLPDLLALSNTPPSFVCVGTREYQGIVFDESSLWSMEILKTSGALVEEDIEECFLIVEYSLLT